MIMITITIMIISISITTETTSITIIITITITLTIIIIIACAARDPGHALHPEQSGELACVHTTRRRTAAEVAKLAVSITI